MTQPPSQSPPEPIVQNSTSLIKNPETIHAHNSRKRLLIPVILVVAILLIVGGWLLLKGDLSAIAGLTAKTSQAGQPVSNNDNSQNPADSIASQSTLAISEQDQQEEFMLVNNVKVQMGMSQRYLESKLGISQEQHNKMHIWQLPTGSRLAASFDEEGLTDATLSGTNPADYFYYYGVKVTLNGDTISGIEKKVVGGCYHFGWFMQYSLAEYVVRGGPEGSWLINFSTTGASGDDEVTDAQLKSQKITSISFGYHNSEPSVEEKYCAGETAGSVNSIATISTATKAGPYDLPSYRGNPLTDNAFNQFIQQNIDGKVQLRLSITDQNARYQVRDGYHGGDPGFKPLQTSQFNYLIFIECSGIDNPEAETAIERCAPSVHWNEQTGQLIGMFRVDGYGEDRGNTLIHLFAM